MKTHYLAFVLTAGAVLTQGTCYAAPRVTFPQAPAASSPNPIAGNSGEQEPAADKTKRAHPKLLPDKEHSKVGSGRNLHRPSSLNRVFAAKSGSLEHKSDPIVPAGRPRVIARSVLIARHGGSNPAFVGGSTNLHAQRTGALDGSLMNHKH